MPRRATEVPNVVRGTKNVGTVGANEGEVVGRLVASANDVREIALSLPGVVEIDSQGFDFRVAGKGFVWSYPERQPGRPRVIRSDIAVLFVGDEAEKQALLKGEPELFFTADGYDGWPLVMLRLERVDGARLEELVTDAWQMRGRSGPVGSSAAEGAS